MEAGNAIGNLTPFIICHSSSDGDVNTVNNETVSIIFSDSEDKTPVNFDKKTLLQIEYFEICLNSGFSESISGCISLGDCSKKDLDILIGLIVQGESILSLAPLEDLLNPAFQESIKNQVSRFAPSHTAEISSKMQQHFESPPVHLAEKILTIYLESSKEDKEKDEEVPELVVCAKEVLFKSIYFENREVADKNFKDIYELQQEIKLLGHKIQKRKNSLINLGHSEVHKEVILGEITFMERKCEQLKEFINSKSKLSELKTMMQHQYVSRYADSHFPEIQSAAEKSLKILENYKVDILRALSLSKANIKRKYLLPYLVGPEAYLFDYYGLTLQENSRNPEYPFCFPYAATNFGYRLENDSPYKLEEEIRNDIQQYTSGLQTCLPPRFIEKDESNREVDEEVRALRPEMLEILNDWRKTSDENVAKLKQFLIDRGEWCQFGITTEDIKISAGQMNPVRVHGTLSKFGRIMNIFFTTYDFKPVISYSITADSVGTKEYLKIFQSAFNAGIGQSSRAPQAAGVR